MTKVGIALILPFGLMRQNSGQEKGARSKTTQGEGMRSNTSWA